MNRHTYEPYLSRKSWTPDQLARVGFFDDGHSPESLSHVLNDQRWITPTHHLKSCGVVLCTTGAFSPFHAGHLRMLEIARAEVEDRGWKVAGAFVIPDHDGYVSKKAGGVAACPASERIHQARVFLKDHPWVQVDPWAALYQDRPLNYTTILERTQCLLEQMGSYQVVYVFGSDNAGFKDAFHEGEFVCVGRPGYQAPDPQALDISSTKVRGKLPIYEVPNPNRPYLIRDDLAWATSQWGDCFNGPLREATQRFLIDLLTIYDQMGYQPVLLDVSHQQACVNALEQSHVSFDRVTGAEHWISRIFPVCTLQDKPAGWASSDLSRIPAGRYALVDDDVASGSTVAEIKRRTPQVEWTETISLTNFCVDPPFFDVVDARDFLFGSRLGGLLVSEGFRVPYITPWVDLYSRAKIPPAAQPAFVKAIIEANVRFYTSLNRAVYDMDNVAFWLRLGFDRHDVMLDVCQALQDWNPNV